MGDIGRPLKRIEFEPIPDNAPAEEPSTPQREPVPA